MVFGVTPSLLTTPTKGGRGLDQIGPGIAPSHVILRKGELRDSISLSRTGTDQRCRPCEPPSSLQADWGLSRSKLFSLNVKTYFGLLGVPVHLRQVNRRRATCPPTSANGCQHDRQTKGENLTECAADPRCFQSSGGGGVNPRDRIWKCAYRVTAHDPSIWAQSRITVETSW